MCSWQSLVSEEKIAGPKYFPIIFRICFSFLKIPSFVYGFAYIYVCASPACLLPTEARKGSQMILRLQLLMSMSCQVGDGNGICSSERSSLNHYTIFPVPGGFVGWCVCVVCFLFLIGSHCPSWLGKMGLLPSLPGFWITGRHHAWIFSVLFFILLTISFPLYFGFQIFFFE